MRKTLNGSPGLWTSANNELAPAGSLKQATGVVIKRPGIIEKLRSYIQYNSPEDSADFSGLDPDGIATYKSCLILSDSVSDKVLTEAAVGSTLFSLRANTPSIAQLPYSGTRVDTALHLAEANGNAYIATRGGAIKFDAIASSGYAAGVARALDIQLTLQAGSLLATGNQVAYRALFGLKDAGSNLILGPPCGRVSATATGAQDVAVKVWMPSAISGAPNATSYFVQVYRTQVGTVAGVDAGEEMQLVYQATLTAIDAGNKFITFVDGTPDNLRGAQGYFCPSQETLAQANYPPPASVDIALFKGAMFYSNTAQKHTARVQLLGVAKNLLTITVAAGGITKSGGSGIYTFTGSPDLSNIPTDGTAKLSSTGNTTPANNGEFVITAVNTGAFTITVTNAAAFTEPGAVTSRAWPSKITIAGVNYYGSINGTETVASQIFKVATAGTAQQNVVDTSASLLRVVNQQATPVVYGHYESGPDDGAGKMLFDTVTLAGAQFTIAAAGTLLYNSFNPTIPSTAAVTSANDAAANRLYYGKANQPEHVPLGSYFDIGARTAPILRIVALRQALLVWKADGLFRVSGDGATFSVSAHDTTLALSNIGSVTVLGNKAYALTSRGVFVVTESAGTLISTAVSDQFRPFNEDFANATYSGQCNAVASEVDQCIYLTQKTASAPFLTPMVYCSSTGAWTKAPPTLTGSATGSSPWGGRQSCVQNGRIFRLMTAGQIMAEAGFDTNETVLPYNPSNSVPSGVRYPINISAVNAGLHQITATAAAGYLGFAVGGVIKENSGSTGRLYLITAVAGSTITLTLYDSSQTDSFAFAVTTPTYAGRASAYIPVPSTVEWVPFSGGDDGLFSRYREVSILLDMNSSVTAASVSAYTEATTSTSIAAQTLANTPLPTGVKTQTQVRCLIPPNMQTSRRLSVVFTHNSGVEVLMISGVSYEVSTLDGSGHEVT